MAKRHVFIGSALAGGLILAASAPAQQKNTLEHTFTRELWPVLQSQCAPCHAKKNPSQLLLPSDGHTAFLKLVAEGQFDPDNHSSIVYRVTTTDNALSFGQRPFDHLWNGAIAGMVLSQRSRSRQPDHTLLHLPAHICQTSVKVADWRDDFH